MTSPTEPHLAGGAWSRDASGFTLVEMLVVVAILGFGLALLATRGPLVSPAAQARQAASTVAQALRLGRSQAIASGHPVPVLLDVSDKRLLVDGKPWADLPRSVGLVVVSAEHTPAKQAGFLFRPTGGASGGQVRLGAGGVSFTVTVEWLTGRVDVRQG